MENGATRRVDDSPSKARIQQVVGALVLGALPLLAGFGISLRADISTVIERIDQQKEHIRIQVQAMHTTLGLIRDDIEELEEWRNSTERDRFRKDDGKEVKDRLNILEKEVREHNSKAEKWINVIERNTAIIMRHDQQLREHSQ